MDHAIVPGPAKHAVGDDRRRRPAQGLLVTFGLSVVLAAAIAFPIWRPLLVAAVIAAPLASWHDRLAAALGAGAAFPRRCSRRQSSSWC